MKGFKQQRERLSYLKLLKKGLTKKKASHITCPQCSQRRNAGKLKEEMYICSRCGFHFRLPATDRIQMILDMGFTEIHPGLVGNDPLEYPGYADKLKTLEEKTGLKDAVLTVIGSIDGMELVCAALEPNFLMGSMGTAVGEKITAAAETAADRRLPLVIFSASGGARMQEGIFSLMQMAKTAAAIKRHSEAGLFYLSVCTHPTTGGVTASFASLGDINIAEPGALIGFAGPRVIEQTIRQKLPEGFQTAEYLENKGFLDAVVSRKDLKEYISGLLKIHSGGSLKRPPYPLMEPDLIGPGIVSGVSAWDRVMEARKITRPRAPRYIERLFPDFVQLRGDRLAGEDASILTGVASFMSLPVTVIGQVKGSNLEENFKYNFGMPSPEGYRKVRRALAQAEKFGRPVITFIDTPGAYPGIEAEERGQGEAIASCIADFSAAKVPIISVVIGEGGSGGALAIGVANSLIMLENSVYSILSPEGFASILWGDAKRAQEAAGLMKMTSTDLQNYGIADHIISEKGGFDTVVESLRSMIFTEISKYQDMDEDSIRSHRYNKYRQIGEYFE